MRNKNKLPLRNVLPKANDFSGLLGKGVSESEIILAGELFKRQMAEKQRRRRPNAPIDTRDGYDVDFLYYLQAARQAVKQTDNLTKIIIAKIALIYYHT